MLSEQDGLSGLSGDPCLKELEVLPTGVLQHHVIEMVIGPTAAGPDRLVHRNKARNTSCHIANYRHAFLRPPANDRASPHGIQQF